MIHAQRDSPHPAAAAHGRVHTSPKDPMLVHLIHSLPVFQTANGTTIYHPGKKMKKASECHTVWVGYI